MSIAQRSNTVKTNSIHFPEWLDMPDEPLLEKLPNHPTANTYGEAYLSIYDTWKDTPEFDEMLHTVQKWYLNERQLILALKELPIGKQRLNVGEGIFGYNLANTKPLNIPSLIIQTFRKSLNLIFGKTSVGKTYVGLTQAIELAIGSEIEGAGVLYIVTEADVERIKKRVRAYVEGNINRLTDDDVEAIYNYLEIKTASEVLEAVNELAQMRVDEGKLRLKKGRKFAGFKRVDLQNSLFSKVFSEWLGEYDYVFVDVWSPLLNGNENTTEYTHKALEPFLNNLQDPDSSLTAVYLIHHTGRDGDEERGTSALGDRVDTKHKITLKGDVLTIQNRKSRDEKLLPDKRYRFETAEWIYDGERQSGSYIMPASSEKTPLERVYEAIVELETARNKEIAELAGVDERIIKERYLDKLEQAERIKQVGRGKWQAIDAD
jgi:hypothetical protein